VPDEAALTPGLDYGLSVIAQRRFSIFWAFYLFKQNCAVRRSTIACSGAPSGALRSYITCSDHVLGSAILLSAGPTSSMECL